MKILHKTKRGARRGASRSRPGQELMRFVKKSQFLWLLLGIGGVVVMTVAILLFIEFGSKTKSEAIHVTPVEVKENAAMNVPGQPVFEFYRMLSANTVEMLFDKTQVDRNHKDDKPKETSKIVRQKTVGVDEHIIFKSRDDLDFNNAKVLYSQLLHLGLDPHILKLYTSSGYLYRVQLGPFASQKQLEVVQKKMPQELQLKFSL